MKKAVIYARYSSRNQTEMSIEGQLMECRKFAKREGYTIIKEYIDRAKTAKSDIEKRIDFQRMINDSAKRQFDFVICYQLDRFARSRYDSAHYKYKLKVNGVRVVSAREAISDDASGILMESVLEGMAEYYSVELSQKVKRGIATSIEKRRFIGGMVPIGFKLTEDKQYEVDPVTAPIVQKVFELYAAGNTLKEIGITITEQYGLKIGNFYNYVGKILDNKQYVGTYTRGGHVVPNAIPQIISDELFQKVALIRNKKKRTPAAGRAEIGNEYVLTTKLFCGICGQMMVGTGGTSKSGKTYHYYGCKSAIKRKGCKKKNITKGYIEDFIVAKAKEQLTTENIALIAKAVVEICKQESNTHVIADLKRKLKDNAKAVNNLLSAIESGEHFGLLSERLTKKQGEKENLEKLLANEELEKDEIEESEVRFFLHHLKNGNVDDIEFRRALIAIFVNSIYLYDDRARIIFNASDRAVEVDYELLGEIEKLENGAGDGGGRCSYMMACAPSFTNKCEPNPGVFCRVGVRICFFTQFYCCRSCSHIVFMLIADYHGFFSSFISGGRQ